MSEQDKAAEQLRACREKWEYAFKKYAQENELKLREYHSHLFGWMAACDWMNNRADSGEAVALNVEVRRCDVCDHIGISDASETQGACHECDWQGDEPVEDKCPGCGHTDCMAAGCPECGGRYALIADRQFTHPRATAVDVRDAERYRAMRSAVYRHNVEIGEATLLLRVIGVCPTLDEFDAAIAAIASREGEGK